MKTFFFFGDSITLGVNDTLAGGWIGRFAGLASQRAGLPVPPSTFYNLASANIRAFKSENAGFPNTAPVSMTPPCPIWFSVSAP